MQNAQSLAGSARIFPEAQARPLHVRHTVRRIWAYLADAVLCAAAYISLGAADRWWRASGVHLFVQFHGYWLRIPTYHLVLTEARLLVPSLIFVGYRIISQWATGFTAGQLVFGLRVVDLSGARISMAQATMRNLLLLVDGIFLVGLAVMLCNYRRQRIGDMVARTLVTRTD